MRRDRRLVPLSRPLFISLSRLPLSYTPAYFTLEHKLQVTRDGGAVAGGPPLFTALSRCAFTPYDDDYPSM